MEDVDDHQLAETKADVAKGQHAVPFQHPKDVLFQRDFRGISLGVKRRRPDLKRIRTIL
jgi:hypothetical protein